MDFTNVSDLSKKSDAAQAFAPVNIFVPEERNANDYDVLSPRVIETKYQVNEKDNGKLLITFEYTRNRFSKNQIFPIYQSDDRGHTWRKVADLKDTKRELGMLCCPQLFEMPEDMGSLKKGDILCMTTSSSDYQEMHFDLYKSQDIGKTWKFVSEMTSTFEYGKHIWEPFFLYKNKRLIVYYSDERDKELEVHARDEGKEVIVSGHSQKLVHQVTTDGESWGDIVTDWEMDVKTARPGMAIVHELADGRYIMTYELMGDVNGSGRNFYLINDNAKEGWKDCIPVDFSGGGSPYNTVLTDGRIVLGAASTGNLWISNTTRPEDGFYQIETPIGAAYNREFIQLKDGNLLIVHGGNISASANNWISCASMALPICDRA